METLEIFQLIKTPAIVLHVISVIFGMGSALVSDLLFNFFTKDKKLNKTENSTLSILKDVVFYSLFVIIFSGLLIFLSDVGKYINSDKFLAKMSILVILLVNGYVLNKYVWPHLLEKNFFTAPQERNVRKVAFACGAISVISWLAVCTLGIVDNLNLEYYIIMSLYLGVLLFGIIVSQFVEKKEFN